LAGCIDSELDAFIERHGLRSMLPTLVKDSIYTVDTLKQVPLKYWKRVYKLDRITLLNVWKDIHAEVRRLKGLSRCMPIALHHGSIVFQRARTRATATRSVAALTSMNVGTQNIDEIATLKADAAPDAKRRWSFTECPTLKKFLVDHSISHLQSIFNYACVNFTVFEAMTEKRFESLGIAPAMRAIIHAAFGRDVRTRAIAPSALHRSPSRSTPVSLRLHRHHHSAVMLMRRLNWSFQPMRSKWASSVRRSTAPAPTSWWIS
jgi:hypothetical protein